MPFETKNVDDEISTCNKTIFNILSITHKSVVCDNKYPPWFNTKMKLLIHEKMKKMQKHWG